MNGPIRVWLTLLAAVARTLLYGWVGALRDLCRPVGGMVGRWLEWLKLSEREKRQRRASNAFCVPINDLAFKRPDPMIYSQADLMRRGLAVTWDNPDIELRRGGVPVPSSLIEKNTEYDIAARVWNGSPEAPVAGLKIKFSYLSFGIGTLSHTSGETTVDLGVRGGSNHPALATMKWTTPSSEGHYCIQVLLEWLDDLNPHNNLGQENTIVGRASSPAVFTFTLRNETLGPQEYRFEVDTYELLAPPPCDQIRPGSHARRHNRQDHPLPPGWSVAITPDRPRLEPGHEQTIRVSATAPAVFKGPQAINVLAFGDEAFAGGVTLHVKDS